MKVLVLGSGGREHAIAWKLSQSSQLTKLQPAVTSLDSPDSYISEKKLKTVQEGIAAKWQEITQEQQETLLTQLNFIRGSMENMEKQQTK